MTVGDMDVQRVVRKRGVVKVEEIEDVVRRVVKRATLERVTRGVVVVVGGSEVVPGISERSD